MCLAKAPAGSGQAAQPVQGYVPNSIQQMGQASGIMGALARAYMAKKGVSGTGANSSTQGTLGPSPSYTGG